MHRLLKDAVNFRRLATSDLNEVGQKKKEEIAATIEKKMLKMEGWGVANYMKDNYAYIKDMPTLFDRLLHFFSSMSFSQFLHILDVFDENEKEFVARLFDKMIDQNEVPDRRILKSIIHWGPVINPKSIREYVHRLLKVLGASIKTLENDEENEIADDNKYQMLYEIRALANDPVASKYVNRQLLEKVLAYYDPSGLPGFNPQKEKKFNEVDIIKILRSKDKSKLENLNYPMLLDIINKSTPRAQQLIRSVLWQAFGLGYDTRKFRIDEENKPVDVDSRPIEIYGKILPAGELDFNSFDPKQQEERQKWRQVFMDYNIIPYIQI